MYKLTELQRNYLTKLNTESKTGFKIIVHDILVIENILKTNSYDGRERDRLNNFIVPDYEKYKKEKSR